jgi:hypothetical protein
MKFLRPGVKGRKYDVWTDRLMPGGADWNPEIEAKARSRDISFCWSPRTRPARTISSTRKSQSSANDSGMGTISISARKLIAECGYHRRDEELAELDAVVAGARRFADLPPRV